MNHEHLLRNVVGALAFMLAASGALAKDAPMTKVQTPILPGIEAPDKVETRLGTLWFFDGFPDDLTVQELCENLHFQHAVQAYLLAIPALDQAAMRRALLQWGSANKTKLTAPGPRKAMSITIGAGVRS